MSRRLIGHLALAITVVWSGLLLVAMDKSNALAFDLRSSVLPAARAIVDGDSLYLTDAQWDGLEPSSFEYVYPPLLAELAAPLLLVPERAAGYIGCLVCLAAILGSLFLVGVRDIRVIAAATISAPVVFAVQHANATSLICLAVAATWRYRHWAPLGAGLAMKLLVWPLLLWLLLTRGIRSALLAASTACVLLLASWSLTGFDGFVGYPHMLNRLEESAAGATYTLHAYGRPTALAVTVVLLAGVWWLRRDEHAAFALAVAAAIAASPLVWIHYAALLLVPLAIRYPRLSWPWALPLAFWLLPGVRPPDALNQAVWLLVCGALVACMALPAAASRLRTRGEASGGTAFRVSTTHAAGPSIESVEKE